MTKFLISSRYTAFRCSSNLTFIGRHISLSYVLQQHRMEYTQSMVKQYSSRGLSRMRCFRRIEPFLNIVLIWTTYHLNLFDYSFDIEQTVCGEFHVSFSVVWSRFLLANVMLSAQLLRWKLSPKIFISSWYASLSLLIILLDFVGNTRIFSLHYKKSGS